MLTLTEPDQHLKGVIGEGAFVIDRLPAKTGRLAAE